METERYRTGLKRVWAAIVDSIIFLPLVIVDEWLPKVTQNNALFSLWLIFSIFIPIIYSIILHYKYGQTIGKWIAGVKVLDISETKYLNLKQSTIRDSIYLLFEVTRVCYYLVLAFQGNDMETVLYDSNDVFVMPLLLWTLLELVTMLTNSKRRAIHDYLAKSVVVNA